MPSCDDLSRRTEQLTGPMLLLLGCEAAGVPAGEQDGGVVLEDAVLVGQDGLDESASGLGWGVAGGGFAFEEVDQPGFAEEGTGGVPGFGDSVGVQDEPVPGLQRLLPDRQLRDVQAQWRAAAAGEGLDD